MGGFFFHQCVISVIISSYMAKDKVKIHFFGGAGDVTGSNFLIETTRLEKNVRILIDCGLYQGRQIGEDRNREAFPYEPASIDYLFVTHSHIDHVGRIPKLVRDGFRGKIISTPPTMDLAEAMLTDSMGVLAKESKYDHKPPIYEAVDVERSMSLWESIPYGKTYNIGPIGVVLRDSGHVLGSAMIEFHYNGKKIVFTGDLGNTPTPLLRNTEVLTDTNYLIMESVYGDRTHEHTKERRERLENVIEDTFRKRGTLMIPAFSLERTQEILYEIERMMEQDRIPLVPVYIDSPLAIKVFDVYKKYESYFNKDVLYLMNKGNEIFNFPQLHFTNATEESKAIDQSPLPKIIIAGSGMSNGGRILHHEKRFLPDARNTLLLIGYQAAGTLGRRLQDGDRRVTIHGQSVEVRATIATIGGYSAHKDSPALLEFVAATLESLEHVYTVMGEPKSAMFLAQRIRDYLGVMATAPSAGDVVEIELWGEWWND